MRPPWCLAPLMALALVPAANAATAGWSALDVDGERVRIFRDEFGRPHVSATTNRALHTAFGYVVAADRLWQLELNRRAARGTLAEVFGASSLASDSYARTTGYTEAELEAQLAGLKERERELFEGYADGINRYIEEAAADPAEKLPLELLASGIGAPAAFSATDIAAISTFVIRLFGAQGGFEADHQAALDMLASVHGADAAYGMLNDMWWVVDSKSYGTIPRRGALGPPAFAPDTRRRAAIDKAWPAYGEQLEDLKRHWDRTGVPSRLGSYAWVVSPKKSANGAAMLYGGPQMGFSAPEIVLEVELKSREGFSVTGMSVPGMPVIAIGRNPRLAWTITSALASDTLDTYTETLCDAGALPGYLYQGGCTPYDLRAELIQVLGGTPQTLPVLRSVHGPVLRRSATVALSQKSSFWGREVQGVIDMVDLGRARDLRRFAQVASRFGPAFNILYADRLGNIAYFAVGCNPLRPAGFDPRLPFPGDGTAEWPGACRPVLSSVNPAQGFLANWNNKPTADYEAADQGTWGPIGQIHRVDEIVAALAQPRISLADMREIPQRIAAGSVPGRESRRLLPYLLGALDAVPASHPLAGPARSVLESWDGNTFSDAIESTAFQPGEVIFSAWLRSCLQNTFGDELGTVVNQATGNMLLHALDQALTGRSAVPPSRDYFNGQDAQAVMSRAFDETLAALAGAQGNDPATWSAPRGTIEFVHPLLGTLASIPSSYRSTYGQIVVLDAQRPYAENILTLGQSGMVTLGASGAPALDEHFMDQLDLYRRFQYKPMPLLFAPRASSLAP